MNWLGKTVQKEIKKSDTILDLGCGIMAPILDTCLSYPKTRLKCQYIVGADCFKQYLEQIKNKKGVSVLNIDLPDGLNIFLDKSFDVVLMLDVLEHLKLNDAFILLEEAERIARSKVIILTPSKYYDNRVMAFGGGCFPHFGSGLEHPYLQHLSFINHESLEKLGFKVSFPEPSKNTYAVKTLCNRH